MKSDHGLIIHPKFEIDRFPLVFYKEKEKVDMKVVGIQGSIQRGLLKGAFGRWKILAQLFFNETRDTDYVWILFVNDSGMQVAQIYAK